MATLTHPEPHTVGPARLRGPLYTGLPIAASVVGVWLTWQVPGSWLGPAMGVVLVVALALALDAALRNERRYWYALVCGLVACGLAFLILLGRFIERIDYWPS